jgi:hypothetical protein
LISPTRTTSASLVEQPGCADWRQIAFSIHGSAKKLSVREFLAFASSLHAQAFDSIVCKENAQLALVLNEIHAVVALTSLHDQRCIETTVGRYG